MVGLDHGQSLGEATGASSGSSSTTKPLESEPGAKLGESLVAIRKDDSLNWQTSPGSIDSEDGSDLASGKCDSSRIEGNVEGAWGSEANPVVARRDSEITGRSPKSYVTCNQSSSRESRAWGRNVNINVSSGWGCMDEPHADLTSGRCRSVVGEDEGANVGDQITSDDCLALASR
jgi:hypothetical protein